MGVYGVTFDDLHTWDAWKLYLTAPATISHPAARVKIVEVPGMDGGLDASDAPAGRVTYETRDLRCCCLSKALPKAWPALYSELLNKLHGKEMKITIDEDPDYYYLGRVSVGKPSYDRAWRIDISATCDPYKYRQASTIIAATVPESGTVVLTLYNDAMPAVPTITADAAVMLGWEGSTYAVSAGAAYRNLDIELAAGDNLLQVTAEPGTTVTVEYQEGSL